MAVSKNSSKSRRVKLPYNRAIQRPAQRQNLPAENNHNRFLAFLTKVFFVLGFLLLVVYLVLRINQEIQLSYITPKGLDENKQTAQEKRHYPLPTEIIIDKVNIDLPVEQAAIKNGVWEIGQKGASHLNISSRPGEPGAVIMYGHNTNDRFGPIRWLGSGDRIDVMTADGKKHTYKITQTMKVKPDKMDVFTQDRGEVLILYTCDGFADLERFIIVAKPI